VALRKWTWLIFSASNPERRLPAARIFDHSANFNLIQTTWSFIKPVPGKRRGQWPSSPEITAAMFERYNKKPRP